MGRQLIDVLEIMLITFNRCELLENTLSQLAESPFARCRITVLDNYSTDLTPQITAKFSDKFPNLHILRHNRNIGGDYNFLRAVELSTSVYTWILCDDDNYDFSQAPEIIPIIEKCVYDLIYVASRSPVQLGCSNFGETTVKQLVTEGARCHRAFAFWPSLIFKTEKYDFYCFCRAPDIFPSFKFINKTVTDDFTIYVAEHEMVIRSIGNEGEMHPLEMYREWVKNASKITDRRLRGYVIDQWTDQGFLKTLAFWIAMERSRRVKGYWNQMMSIFIAVTLWQKIKFITLLPVIIVPLPVNLLMRIRIIVYRLMARVDTPPPVKVTAR